MLRMICLSLGDCMGKATRKKRKKSYYKIYEQIYEDPLIPLCHISENTGLSRNTVSKYLREMYAKGILVGPQISMNSAPNYRQYVYLMNFENPLPVFEQLKTFPHVLHHAVSFGDWNTMVVSDRLLDFSTLVGFQSMVFRGVKYSSHTPRVDYTMWHKPFKKMREELAKFTPSESENKDRRLSPFLDWGEDQWKLYHTFKRNIRKKVQPTLRKINVRYERYTKWMNTLENHCTIHTGFYPEGYQHYVTHCFLFSSDHEQSVKSLTTLIPVSPFIMEVGKQLLVVMNIPTSSITRTLFCTLYDMKTVKMIKGFNKAVALFYHR